MSWLQAFILGLVQGITEFLPISSSAHLKLAKMLFGVESSESQVIFDLVCHLGTLLAVLYFFRWAILRLFTKERKTLYLLIIGTLPLIPFYLLLKPLREFASAPQFLGLCMMATASILFIGQRWRVKKPKEGQSVRDVLFIGTMQATALIPGISRSASTISCAQVLGWDALQAVRFSFLLSIPTVLGGNCVELLKLATSQIGSLSISYTHCLIGFATSCIAGLIMVRFALVILQKGNLKPFAWYCLIIGSAVTVYFNFLPG